MEKHIIDGHTVIVLGEALEFDCVLDDVDENILNKLLKEIDTKYNRNVIQSALLQKLNEAKSKKFIEEAKKTLKNLFDKQVNELHECMNKMLETLDGSIKSVIDEDDEKYIIEKIKEIPK